MSAKVYSIRGAITVKANTIEEITEKSNTLYWEMMDSNPGIEEVVNIIISTTQDITAAYPAKAIRENSCCDAPLFSCVEPAVDHSLSLCIRMMMTVVGKRAAHHVYMEGAKVLRPDLCD